MAPSMTERGRSAARSGAQPDGLRRSDPPGRHYRGRSAGPSRLTSLSQRGSKPRAEPASIETTQSRIFGYFVRRIEHAEPICSATLAINTSSHDRQCSTSRYDRYGRRPPRRSPVAAGVSRRIERDVSSKTQPLNIRKRPRNCGRYRHFATASRCSRHLNEIFTAYPSQRLSLPQGLSDET